MTDITKLTLAPNENAITIDSDNCLEIDTMDSYYVIIDESDAIAIAKHFNLTERDIVDRPSDKDMEDLHDAVKSVETKSTGIPTREHPAANLMCDSGCGALDLGVRSKK